MVNAASAPKRVALIGECMIELSGPAFGPQQQGFGGDSLNTALYLARLAGRALEVNYVTAVGIDPWSEQLLQRWIAEGIDTSMVLRDATRLPGLYSIQIGAQGERSFYYWRSDSAARYLLQHPDAHGIIAQLPQMDLIYLSGISVAILPENDRARLLELLRQLAARGLPIAFDSNYRPALWASLQSARATIATVQTCARLSLVTFDDEQRLWGDLTPRDTAARLHAAGVREVIIKHGAAGCFLSRDRQFETIPAPPIQAVIDTTAAGDAFNAAFLAGWLLGHQAEACCRAGNALAATVIQHRGAIIAASLTPTLAALLPTAERP